MPCLSVPFDPKIGPIIPLGIGAPQVEAAQKAGTQRAHFERVRALIDTGADLTCITRALADKIGVRSIGKLPMCSATHTIPTDTYMIDLFIPFQQTGFIIGNLKVMEFAARNDARCQVLLGRDVICQGIFTIGMDKRITFSI